MKYNVFTYLIGEGFSNVFKNTRQAMTSLTMMCVTMIAFGIFFMIIENVNYFVEQVEAGQGIQVFMNNGVTEEEIQNIGKEILSINGVNTIEFVSKDAALNQMKEKLGEKAYLLNGYDNNNILPDSYIVTLTDLSLSSDVQNQISALDKIKNITSSDETMNTLVKIARGIKIGTYIILALLIGFSVFIIANTIKLTVHARRKEISIMKYVGATNGFIRWPFIVEGIIIGLISGAVSIVIILAIYNLISKGESFILATIGLQLLQFGDMFNSIVIVYLILGVGIGILGSSISMRKYLKV